MCLAACRVIGRSRQPLHVVNRERRPEITNSILVLHRLFNKFNYRIVWADQTKGPAMLAVANYGFGEYAAYSSWVILAAAD